MKNKTQEAYEIRVNESIKTLLKQLSDYSQAYPLSFLNFIKNDVVIGKMKAIFSFINVKS